MPAKAVSPNGNNVMLGRGQVFGDRLTVVNGVSTKTGEFDLGNCTTCEVTPKAETKEKYESMDANSSLYARAVTRQTHTLKITGDEYSLFNLANAIMGNLGSIAVTGATISGSPGETITTNPKGGAWYSLKFRSVSAVTVKLGATTLVLTTDYLLDPVRGRIYIVPGGAGDAVGTLTAGYTYATYSFNTVVGGNQSSVDMYIRFIGAPVKGPVFEGDFWHVQFTPSGSLGLIQDDFGNWTIEGMIIQDNTISPDASLYRLIQIS